MYKKIAAVLLAFVIPLIPLSADSIWNNIHMAGMGSIFYFPANNGVDSDPAPILPTLGFSIAYQLFGPLRIELTEDIYLTNYEYNSNLGYPMACNPENRSALVIGLVTGIQVTGAIPIGESGTLARVYGGPAADFRIITLAAGLNHPVDFEGDIETNPRLQTDAISEYFWSDARWFMPVFGAGMDFPISEKLLLGFDLRVWFPIYKLWTNDETSAIDGWRFGAGLRITPRKSQ